VNYLRAFAAGFVSTLIFHQGVIALFYLLGAFPRAPWSMVATPPLGVPAVISLSFWAGIWGVVLWPALRSAGGKAYWIRAIVLGAIGPTAVALFVVFPLKGGAFAAGWDPKIIVGGLIVNGVWGFGLALLLRLFRRFGF
jgi:hypothetical protein